MITTSLRASGRLRSTRSRACAGLLIAGAVLYLVAQLSGNNAIAVAGLSALSLCVGLGTFVVDGDSRITASGCFGFGVAAFVGFPGLYLTAIDQSDGLLGIVSISFFASTIILWFAHPPRTAGVKLPCLDARDSAAAMLTGVLVIAVGAVLWRLEARGDSGASIVAIGVLLVAVGSILRSQGPSWWWATVPLACAAFYACLSAFSADQGRLRLGTLGIGIAIVATPRLKRRLGKWLVLVAVGPLVAILAFRRVQLDPSYRSVADGSGLESMTAPLPAGAQMLDLFGQGIVPHYWGQTYVTSALAFVPRQVWPGKPLGWGSEIVQYLSPDLVGTNQSYAVGLYVEAIVNFGYVVGLAAICVAMIFVLKGLDRIALRHNSPVRADRSLVVYVAIVVALAGIPDLLWAGSFTYVSRLEVRLLALLVVAWPLLILVRVLLVRLQRRRASP